MLKLFLWLRYLRKKKIVLLSIAAVALSVTLMVTVDSLFTGYIDALGKMVLSDMGDVLIWPIGSPIDNYQRFIDKLKEHPDIETAAPFHYGAGLLYIEGADVREVVLYGLEPKCEKGFNNWGEKLLRQKQSDHISMPSREPDFSVPGESALGPLRPTSEESETSPTGGLNEEGVWLGINIVAEPNEQTDEYDLEYAKGFIGKQVILTTMGHGGKRYVEKMRVSDVVFSKSYFGDKTVYMPFKMLQRIETGNEKADDAYFIKLKLVGHDAFLPAATPRLLAEDKCGVSRGGRRKQEAGQQMVEDIRAIWNDYATGQMGYEPGAVPALRIELRERMYRNIFEDLRNQLTVILLIFGVICSVAVLLIFCIFYMIVTAKQKDIAIIKSCGASSVSAAAIFAGFGACVGVVGSVLGAVLGIIITNNINVLEKWVRVLFGIKFWRTSSYGLAEIPHQINWPVVPWVVLAAIAGCVIGVLIPSIIAARTRPVKILRYE
ncbi:MAG: ABC transporter permease [Sedimentisphaerales bacterium]|nr:ABC transporter permease [Sedimentisphaerales bacterium]